MIGGQRPDQGKDATTAAFGSFEVVFGLWLISAVFVFGSVAWIVAAFAADPDRTGGGTLIGTPVFNWVLAGLLAVWTAAGAVLLTGWADRRAGVEATAGMPPSGTR